MYAAHTRDANVCQTHTRNPHPRIFLIFKMDANEVAAHKSTLHKSTQSCLCARLCIFPFTFLGLAICGESFSHSITFPSLDAREELNYFLISSVDCE